MNSDAGCQNIYIDNNDDKDSKMDFEEENEDNSDDDEEGSDEDNDEPDFMDNSGKCWEFGSKIEDEKHLKEWCQNKMGGMIVGKEEKLTRQFHCQIKQCQFKAIFLKSCSTIYTRNKHNHGMENEKNIRRKKKEKKNQTSALEQNYADRRGQLWPLHAKIGKNITHDKLLTKFGFTSIAKYPKILYLHCQRVNPNVGKCKFAGIYLKSNGYLYIRGKHEHTQNGKTPQNVGEDYIDFRGQIWQFNEEIGPNIQHEMLRSKFGFTRIAPTGIGLNLLCQRQNKKCKFTGIYLNSNGCLYTRGKHSHAHIEKIKNPKPTVGNDYVDCQGKVWPFFAKIDKQNVSNPIWYIKFGFSSVQESSSTLNLYCHKRTTNGGRCPIKGIYLKSNECLYIRGKHEHKRVDEFA